MLSKIHSFREWPPFQIIRSHFRIPDEVLAQVTCTSSYFVYAPIHSTTRNSNGSPSSTFSGSYRQFNHIVSSFYQFRVRPPQGLRKLSYARRKYQLFQKASCEGKLELQAPILCPLTRSLIVTASWTANFRFFRTRSRISE